MRFTYNVPSLLDRAKRPVYRVPEVDLRPEGSIQDNTVERSRDFCEMKRLVEGLTKLERMAMRLAILAEDPMGKDPVVADIKLVLDSLKEGDEK